MAYSGGARFRYEGPMALCVQYIRPARVLAENLMQQVIMHGVSSATRSFRYDEGSFIRVSVFQDAPPIITINTLHDVRVEDDEKFSTFGKPVPPTGLSVFDENDLVAGSFVLRYDGKKADYWTVIDVVNDNKVSYKLSGHMPPPHFLRDAYSLKDGSPTGNASEELCRRGLRMAASMTHVLKSPSGRVLAIDGGMVAGSFRDDGSAEAWDRMRRRTSWRMLADDGSVVFVHTDMRDHDPVPFGEEEQSDTQIPYTYKWGFAAAGWPGDYEGEGALQELRFFVSSSPDYFEAKEQDPIVVNISSLHRLSSSKVYRRGDEESVTVIPLDISESGRKLLVLVVARASWAFSGPISNPVNTTVAEIEFIGNAGSASASARILEETRVTSNSSHNEEKDVDTYVKKEDTHIKDNAPAPTVEHTRVVSITEAPALQHGNGKHIHIGYKVFLRNFTVKRSAPVFAHYDEENPVVHVVDKQLFASDSLLTADNSVIVSGEVTNPTTFSRFDVDGGISVELGTDISFHSRVLVGGSEKKRYEITGTIENKAVSSFISVYVDLLQSRANLNLETSRSLSVRYGGFSASTNFISRRTVSAVNLYSLCYDRDATLILERPLADQDLFCELLQSFQNDGFLSFDGGIAYEPVCNKVARFVAYNDEQAVLQDFCVEGELLDDGEESISSDPAALSAHKLGTAYNSETKDLVHSASQSICFVGSVMEKQEDDGISVVNKQHGELSSERFGISSYENLLDTHD